jgi:hypothetical protein
MRNNIEAGGDGRRPTLIRREYMRMSRSTGGSSRRRLVVGILTVGLSLGGSVAYAFWTGSGTGSGSAQTALESGGEVSISPIQQPTSLTPGQWQPISLVVTNLSPATVYFNSVHIEIDPAWTPTGQNSALPLCTAADFEFYDAPGPYSLGQSIGQTVIGQMRLANSGANQDNCKGQSVDLLFTPVP